jgi:ribosomal-protein-alanine N-acetyltransferase
MTPHHFALLHAACFTTPAPWSVDAIAGVLADPSCHLVVDDAIHPRGFALFRAVMDEAELLTIAVHPDVRRQGIAVRLIRQGLAELSHAKVCFLEVAVSNVSARALYAQLGFAQAGLRRGYFAHSDGRREDALILKATLPLPARDTRFSC